MSSDRDRLNALMQTQLYPFVRKSFGTLHPGQSIIPAWHVQAMCWSLQRVASGDCRRLLITVPPRHLKTICTSVCLPAWLLGNDPALKVLVASYGHDLAGNHARDFRTIIEAPWYRQLFPGMARSPRRNAETEMLTNSGGGRKAVSLGGAVTGFGADVLIIDDLMKAGDAQSVVERQRARDYCEQSLFTRLNDKQTGRIVAIQQRIHEDDIAGYLIDKGNFEHLNLRAIAEEDETFELGLGGIHTRRKGEALFPGHEPLHTLEGIRRDIGSFAFSAQYQQNPVAPGGNLVRWEWFGTYDEQPPRTDVQMVVQSWDTAMSADPNSDFSVCTTWGYRQQKWYLLDVYRRQLDYPDLKRRIIDMRRQWQADRVIIERAASGIPLLSELRQDFPGAYMGYKPLVDKETRLRAQTAKIQAGLVVIPARADWLAAFKHEVLAFPNGRDDDQVDSMAQFLDWVGSRHGRGWQDCQLHGGRPSGLNRPQGRSCL